MPWMVVPSFCMRWCETPFAIRFGLIEVCEAGRVPCCLKAGGGVPGTTGFCPFIPSWQAAFILKAGFARVRDEGRLPAGSNGQKAPKYWGDFAPSFQTTRTLSLHSRPQSNLSFPRMAFYTIAYKSKEPPSTATITPANIAIMQLLIRRRRTVLIYFRRHLLIPLCDNAKQLPTKCLPGKSHS